MSEPERLMKGSGCDVEIALLRSAKPDDPSGRCVRTTLVALGLSSGVAATASAATAATVAAKAGASMPPAAIAATQGGISVLVKWVGIAGVTGLVAWGAVTQLAPNRAEVAQNGAATLPQEPTNAAIHPVEPAAEHAGTSPEPTPETPQPADTAVPTPSPAEIPPAKPTPAKQAPAKQTPTLPAPATAKKPSLSDEVAALDKARKAMADDPDAALAALEAYDKGFKGGVLAQEAEVLKIEALARAGKKAEAKTAAGAFHARHPNSPLAGRVNRAIQ